ncbi:replication-relaxation family protein [Bacillus infantis]|uniref:replication-relaxation family protein n=1 Tax=Bacillus infantis TaxID=324767 RepID=UPI003CEC7C16
MKTRDMAILNDLQRFRCLSRDDIIDMHFQGLKQPVTSCNTVLKRLRRDGYIEVNNDRQPYIYFPAPASIKKDSAKIPHFLMIAQFYKQALVYDVPKTFIVEPKYGKEYMEPDAFMIWKRAPFFVEIQRSVYSDKVMQEKARRYEAYYHSREWEKEPWQPEKKAFPVVIMVTDTKYNIASSCVRFIQVQSPEQLLAMFIPKPGININGSLKLKTS